jgi:YHS domain-containing protein
MVRFLGYLINLVFITIIGWILARLIQRVFGTPRIHSQGSWSAPRRANPGQVVEGKTARDPVCGMFVSTELSHRLKRGNETLHFCSRECLERYKADATHS